MRQESFSVVLYEEESSRPVAGERGKYKQSVESLYLSFGDHGPLIKVSSAVEQCARFRLTDGLLHIDPVERNAGFVDGFTDELPELGRIGKAEVRMYFGESDTGQRVFLDTRAPPDASYWQFQGHNGVGEVYVSVNDTEEDPFLSGPFGREQAHSGSAVVMRNEGTGVHGLVDKNNYEKAVEEETLTTVIPV